MKSTQPITPHEIKQGRIDAFPDCVIRAVNMLLANAMDRYGRARLRQPDVIEAIIDELKTDGMPDSCMPTLEEMVERGYFKFKPVFAPAGWSMSTLFEDTEERTPVYMFQAMSSP